MTSRLAPRSEPDLYRRYADLLYASFATEPGFEEGVLIASTERKAALARGGPSPHAEGADSR